MPKRELTLEEKELLKKIAQAVAEHNSESVKSAFAEFKDLCGLGILGQGAQCPEALSGVEGTFARLGLYIGEHPIPEVINFDNVVIGGAAAAHEG